MDKELPVDLIREDFPALKQKRNGKPPIYLDNACTTLVPSPVIEALEQYYNQFPACGSGRSRHWFAEEVNGRIKGDLQKGWPGSRRIIQEFINARSEEEIIFTMNTSQAINMVALGFGFRPGDVVLLTDKEHNSNLVPWLRLEKMGTIQVDTLPAGADETFDLTRLEEKLKKTRVRLISLAYTSNLTGYTLPAKEIIKVARRFGARVLLDGAQTVPHKTVDVQDLDVDFLAFSLHKMCGPRGVGVLYGKRELMGVDRDVEKDCLEPVMLGGGTVRDTSYDSYQLLGPPDAFEAGVQDYAGQIAAGTAVQYLEKIGLDRIGRHETCLNNFLTEQLLNLYGETGWFRILGPGDAPQRGGVLTFEVKRPNAVGITEELDARNNIMIRDGLFCVHSYLNKKYGPDWTRPGLPSEHRMVYRLSLYFYNTLEECRIFIETLDRIFRDRSYLL